MVKLWRTPRVREKDKMLSKQRQIVSWTTNDLKCSTLFWILQSSINRCHFRWYQPCGCVSFASWIYCYSRLTKYYVVRCNSSYSMVVNLYNFRIEHVWGLRIINWLLQCLPLTLHVMLFHLVCIYVHSCCVYFYILWITFHKLCCLTFLDQIQIPRVCES